MKVVVAPDSFKGTITATEAAAAIADGWRSVRPADDVVELPLADGGEGTLDAVETAMPGAARRSAGYVSGPDGVPVPGEWLALPDGTAVIELAQMCGLPLMGALDPEGASTLGLGQVIRAAVDSGAKRLVVGLGGSASTDAGAGALAALGLEADGSLVAGGAALASLRRVDRSHLIPAPPTVILTDVDAPLTGPRGAAALFGPQKGADAAQVVRLDRALAHFAGLLGGPTDDPGMGAAGGTGYGLSAWGGQLESGAGWIFAIMHLEPRIAGADVVLTGEGRFDATSIGGKLVGEVLRLCAEFGTPSGVLAGQVAVAPDCALSISLTDLAGSAEAAIADPRGYLVRAGATAAQRLGSDVGQRGA